MDKELTSHQERQERAIRTRDGSFTFYSSRFNQHYHSQFGAEAESNYVFLKGCRIEEKMLNYSMVNVFEVGFGTGLNFLLTSELAHKSQKQLHFFSVEKYPLSSAQILEFDYVTRFPKEIVGGFLLAYEDFKEGWNHVSITDLIHLNLFIGDFSDMEFPTGVSFDAFYQDAFSPDVNADLWSDSVFAKLHNVANEDAILSTYGSATMARAAMAAGGWFPCRFPGGVGKREMTIAFASQNFVDLKLLNTERLKQRWLERDQISD